MPARIVIAHDDLKFVAPLTDAVRRAGLDATTFNNPMVAYDALLAASTVEVLVTAVDFGSGVQYGVALAEMAQERRRRLRVLFVDGPEYAHYAKGIGEFIPMPAKVPEVVAAVTRLLDVDTRSAC